MGFSQGGALAASLILEQTKHDPLNPLFRFAIFISATLPFDVDDTLGLDAWHDARAVFRHKVQTHTLRYPGIFAGEIDVAEPLGFPDDLTGTILNRFHPLKNKERIGIPSVHIIGRKDAYRPQCELLSELCVGAGREVIEHDDGHRVPKDAKMSQAIVKSISSVIMSVSFTN